MTHREPRDADVPASPARYRVEHCAGEAVVVLASVDGVPAHHATLVPFVSLLLRHGAAGELRLIDATTDAVVARRRVRPFSGKGGDPFRQRVQPSRQLR